MIVDGPCCGIVGAMLRPAITALLLTATLVPTAHAAAQSRPPGVAHVPVPVAARAVNTSHPTRWVGHGTAGSCTSRAVVAAVRRGGIIRFRCGPKPVTIVMHRTAKVVNTHRRVVLDGGGTVTLSGAGRRRVLYMDTCDAKQVWTTSHCQNQATPNLVVQNMRFVDGNSIGQDFDGGGGGAIFVRGGRVKIVNSTFAGNRAELRGPDIGGGAVRVLSQFRNRPVYVVNSRFVHNVASNGGALSSIGVSWTVLNSRFRHNRAVGNATRGGGSGAAIYNDGDRYALTIGGTWMHDNHANEGGGAVFFVSNDRTGTMSIRWSTLRHNPNDGFQTAGLPGIFFLGARPPAIRHSILR
jgi:hypothetical protein